MPLQLENRQLGTWFENLVSYFHSSLLRNSDMKIKAIAVTAMLACATSAYAENLYVVGSAGQSHFNGDGSNQSNYDKQFTTNGAVVQSSNLGNTDTGYKLLLGAQLHPNFAVEGGYVNFGKTSHNATLSDGSGSSSLKAHAVVVDAVGIYPVTTDLSLFGKAGVYHSKSTTNVSANSTSLGPAYGTSNSSSGNDLNYGVGLTYAVNKTFSVRGELEQFRKVADNVSPGGTSNVNLVSVGVAAKF
jgi:opacity protein-like surface antigen